MGYLHGGEVKPYITGSGGIMDASAPVIGIIGVSEKGDKDTPILISGSPEKAMEIFGASGTIFNAIDAICLHKKCNIIVVRVEGTKEDPGKAVDQMLRTEPGKRVGVSAFLDARQKYGIAPKILIAPHFTHPIAGDKNKLLVDKLTSIANACYGKVVIDMPDETIVKAIEYWKLVKGSEKIYGIYPWARVPANGAEAITAEIERLNDEIHTKEQIIKAFTDLKTEDENLKTAQTSQKELADAEYQTAKQHDDAGSNDDTKKRLHEAKAKLDAIADLLAATTKRIADTQTKIDPKNTELAALKTSLETKKSDMKTLIDNAKEPHSAYVAGLMAQVEADEGFWVSPSNHQLKGTLGTTQAVSWQVNDESCEANLLNKNGIATVISYNGLRLWGNRTASAEPRYKFISTVNVCNAIDESILNSVMDYLDKPVNRDFFTKIKDDVGAFLRLKAAQGAILGGNCWVDNTVNTPQTIMNGEVTADYDFTEPGTAERVTFRRYLTTKYAEEALK